MRTIPLFIIALFAAACSSSPTSPSSSGGPSASPQFSTADDRPTGNPDISQPSDAPTGFDFDWQGEYDGTGRNSAFVVWTHVLNATKYEVEFQRFETTGAWVTAFVAGFNYTGPGSTKGSVQLTDGRWRARVRIARMPGAPSANWTPFVFASRETPHVEAPPLDECEWFEDGPSVWSFRFR